MPRAYKPKTLTRDLPKIVVPRDRFFAPVDPTFVRPAPPTADRGIGRLQLKKHNRQQLLKARNIRRSRST